MFEARMASVATLKKLVDAIKDLLTEATWDVGENGLALQVIKKFYFSSLSCKTSLKILTISFLFCSLIRRWTAAMSLWFL